MSFKRKHLCVLLLLIAVIFGLENNSTDSTSAFMLYKGKSLCKTNVTIPTYYVPGKMKPCDDGFYCPFFVEGNASTYPVICPPDVECSVKRHMNTWCEQQGRNEPILCSAGYYCPDMYTYHKCPKGSYCPLGSKYPTPCPFVSYCPLESVEYVQWGALLLTLLVDIPLVCMYIFYWRYDKKKSKREAKEYFASRAMLQGDKEKEVSTMIESVNKCRGTNPAFDFEFENLGLILPNGKSILSNVSGKIPSGKITAILGPSGAGKTTFMSVLMDKVNRNCVRQGKIFVNGKQYKNIKLFKKFIGYVPQEDVMHRELSVGDNILYSANVRLPDNWSASEKRAHYDAVMEILDLKMIKDSVVGDEDTRGISGGQRKRTNIGIELAAAPLILFCDEPTSGLDSSSSLHIINVFKSISLLTKITTVIVIHQPRIEIWNSLDNILILAPGGLTVYSGKQKLCRSYFEILLQVEFNSNENEADKIIDSVSINGLEYAKIWESTGKKYMDNVNDEDEQDAMLANVASTLSLKMNNSSLLNLKTSSVDMKIKVQAENSEDGENLNDDVAYGAGFFKQFYYSFCRSIKQQYMTLDSFLLEVGLSCLAGVILGVAGKLHYYGSLRPPYIDISPSTESTTLPQKSLFLQISVGIAASSSSVRVFGDEKSIFLREASSGHNMYAYFLSVSLAVVFRFLLNALHYSCLFHITSRGYSDFGLLFVNVLLNFYSVYGLTSAISIVLPKKDASLLAAVVVVIFCTMDGYVRAMPDWLKYMFYTFWSSEAYFNTETKFFRKKFLVDDVAANFSYDLNRLAMDYLLMLVIGTVYRIIALPALLIFIYSKKQ